MADTVNQRLQDAATSHAVDQQHYSNGVVARMIALANRTDADLMAQIQAAASQLEPSTFTTDRLDSLLYGVRSINQQLYANIGRELTTELAQLVPYELGYNEQLFKSVIPRSIVAQLNITVPSSIQVYSAAMARPWAKIGILKDALQGMEAGNARLIKQAIQTGFTTNETIDQMVRRIRGTRVNGYADGLLEMPRRHIETLVRTAVSSTASFARDKFYESNKDIIAAEIWHSTLDNRTSIMYCIPRDSKRYTPVDHKPIGHSFPWLQGPGSCHPACRSVSVVQTKAVGKLPGIDPTTLTGSARSSMDGTVASSVAYSDWIKKQSASRQDEVLGKTRADELRAGASVDSFFNRKGRLLSIDEMKARDSANFAANSNSD